MNEIASIISQLENQRASIDRAISALREIDGSSKAAAAPRAAQKKVGQKRHISPEGRKRIAEATRRRWAAKRAADAAANPGSPKKAAAKRAARAKKTG